ncbi:septum formation family protein [Agromyces ramosus]|nr:septum formation family protein [Agromyces ramosus]
MPRNRPIAALALAIAAAALAVSGCSGGSAQPSTPPTPPSASASNAPTAPAPTGARPEPQQSSGDTAPFVPAVGDCLDASKEHGLSPSSVVPCEEPHDDEVYAQFDLDGGGFPGDDAVARAAHDACASRFEAFVGIAHADSALEFYTLHPTTESWSTSGARTVSCIIWNPTDHVTGSLEGAAY